MEYLHQNPRHHICQNILQIAVTKRNKKIDEVNFNKEDLKLVDNKAKKIISEFVSRFSKLDQLNKETLEPIINELIKSNETNFKGVGQPLRIVLTGSKFGPGIYDIISSLGKEEVQKRLGSKIT